MWRQGVFARRAGSPLAAAEIKLLHALGGSAAGSLIMQLWREARQGMSVCDVGQVH